MHKLDRIKRIINDNSDFFLTFSRWMHYRRKEKKIDGAFQKLSLQYYKTLIMPLQESGADKNLSVHKDIERKRKKLADEVKFRKQFNSLESRLREQYAEVAPKVISYGHFVTDSLRKDHQLRIFVDYVLKNDISKLYDHLGECEQDVLDPFLDQLGKKPLRVDKSSVFKPKKTKKKKEYKPKKTQPSYEKPILETELSGRKRTLTRQYPKFSIAEPKRKLYKKPPDKKTQSIKKKIPTHPKPKTTSRKPDDLFELRKQHQNFFYMLEQWSVNHYAYRHMPIEERIIDYLDKNFKFRKELEKYHQKGVFTEKMHSKLDDILYSQYAKDRTYDISHNEFDTYKKKVTRLEHENEELRKKINTFGVMAEKAQSNYKNLERRVDELSSAQQIYSKCVGQSPELINIGEDRELSDAKDKNVENKKKPYTIEQGNHQQTETTKKSMTQELVKRESDTPYRIRTFLKEVWSATRSLFKYK